MLALLPSRPTACTPGRPSEKVELTWAPCLLSELTFSCRVLRLCDLALHSAADSGNEVTEEANQRFNEATQVLSRYSERWHPAHQ